MERDGSRPRSRAGRGRRQPRPDSSRRGVLADHFTRGRCCSSATRFPGGAESRKGVPQARHVHVLLKQGERILADYFPGICDELVAGGSSRVDMAGDTRWFYFGDWKARFASGIDHALSRAGAFLEWQRARSASRRFRTSRIAGRAQRRRPRGRRRGTRSRRPPRPEGEADAAELDSRPARRRERSRLAHAALAAQDAGLSGAARDARCRSTSATRAGSIAGRASPRRLARAS